MRPLRHHTRSRPALPGRAVRAAAWLAALLMGTSVLPLQAATPSARQLQALEAAFNGEGDLGAVLGGSPDLEPGLVARRRQLLLSRFPDARWQISTGPTLRDGRQTVLLRVRGSRQDGPLRFRLEAEQQLALESDGSRITAQTLIREQALLRTGDTDLRVSLLIPDAVLTGQRYDVDVVLDEPLEGAIVAGGIVGLSPDQVTAFESPALQLGALGGGGLFRTVQAPFSPGSQTWAVLLVHPQGLVSASKRVRVVADKAQLSP